MTDFPEERVVDDARGLGGEVGDVVSEVCDRFTFFVGGCWASVVAAGFDTEGR